MMAGDLGDGRVHALTHPPVRLVALGARAEFEHVDRLAGVELHRVAHAVGQRNRIGGLVRKVVVKQVVEGSRAFHHRIELADEPGGIDRRWTHEAVTG